MVALYIGSNTLYSSSPSIRNTSFLQLSLYLNKAGFLALPTCCLYVLNVLLTALPDCAYTTVKPAQAFTWHDMSALRSHSYTCSLCQKYRSVLHVLEGLALLHAGPSLSKPMFLQLQMLWIWTPCLDQWGSQSLPALLTKTWCMELLPGQLACTRMVGPMQPTNPTHYARVTLLLGLACKLSSYYMHNL